MTNRRKNIWIHRAAMGLGIALAAWALLTEYVLYCDDIRKLYAVAAFLASVWITFRMQSYLIGFKHTANK